MPNPWFTTRGQIIQTIVALASMAIAAFKAWPDLQKTQLFTPGAILFYALITLVVFSIWSLKAGVREVANTTSGQMLNDRPPRIQLIEVAVTEAKGAATYPLKCLAQMRNDSASCVDVQVSGYTAQGATLKNFVTEVPIKFAKCAGALGFSRSG
jgi:hypothetical protein